MKTENELTDAGNVGWAGGASRRRGAQCLSDLQLDQLTLNELDGVTADRARLHLGQCGACFEASKSLLADHRGFEQTVNVGHMTAGILAKAYPETPSRWGRFLALPMGLGVAAAAAFIVMARPPQPGATSGQRAKGGGLGDLRLETYVKLAGQEEAAPGSLYMGQPLGAGDRVQFRVTTATPGHLAILSAARGINGATEFAVFYPAGSTTAPIAAGKDIPLGNAVELDEAQGVETVVALLCESERPLAFLLQAAQKAVAGPNGIAEPLRTGCVEARTMITKSTRSTRR